MLTVRRGILLHMICAAAAPVGCPVSTLPDVTNGTWPCRAEADSSGNLAPTTTCTVECAEGFKVDAETTPTTTCTTSGTWSERANLTCGEGWVGAGRGKESKGWGQGGAAVLKHVVARLSAWLAAVNSDGSSLGGSSTTCSA
jgi:hypothetical protein